MSAFVMLQHVLPQHTFSRVVLWATRLRFAPWKDALIGAFVRGYRPELGDARVTDPFAYESFNAFFTRALRDGARPQPADKAAIASPVDGTMSQYGRIAAGRLIQAKGQDYALDALLSGAAAQWAPRFVDGDFATIYLAPYNYHRIHMPVDGTLREAWYVPGRLFSVNAATAAELPGLFARNERVVLLFDGPCGPFAVILVGALFVGSMATVWHGDVTPRRPRRATALPVDTAAAALARGSELGRFNMGSTVILLFGPGRVALDGGVGTGQAVRLGQRLGTVSGAATAPASGPAGS